MSIIEHTAELHLTEAEVARDFAAVLDKIQHGVEVIVGRNSQPVAVIKPTQFRGRSIDECIASLGSTVHTLRWMRALQRTSKKSIDSQRAPFDPPRWD